MSDLSTITERVVRDLDQLVSTDVLRHATELAVQNVDGCEAAAVSQITQGRKVSTPAASHSSARHGDVLQYETGEGPCLHAISQERLVRVPDIAREERWPAWAARMARESGYRSMLVLQLWTHRETIGALNLYATRPHAFGADDEEAGLTLAALVAVAVARDKAVEHLTVALDRRTTIGRAQGILMERFGLDEATAFAALARVSSHTNRKLHDIASELVETRAVPRTDAPDVAADLAPGSGPGAPR